MQILIKLKEDSKFNKVVTSLGTFKKGIISTIDSKYFDESIMEEIKPKEEVSKKEVPVKPKILSKKDLFRLNKKEQVKIIESFTTGKIPQLEKSRVNLILKLQK